MNDAIKIKPVGNFEEEETLEKEVRVAELLARRAEARLRQLEAERKRSELLRSRKAGAAESLATGKS